MEVEMYRDAGLKYVYEKAVGLLNIAYDCGGLAYGKFVRKVITKVIVHDFSETEVDCVHIWFKKKKDEQNFLAASGLVENCGGLYNYTDNFGDILFMVDTRTDDVLDTKFDVNLLTWNPVSRSFGSGSPDYSVSFLLKKMRKKKVSLRVEHGASMQEAVNAWREKGWRIFNIYDDELIPEGDV